jgi:hypothetical protein
MKIESSRSVAPSHAPRRAASALTAPAFAPALEAPQSAMAASPARAVTPL